MEFCPTMKEGTRLDKVSIMLPEGSIARSLPLKTSIGADDSVRVRSVRRVPVIMTSSVGAAVAPGAPVGCSWAKAIFVAAASVAAARMIRKNFIRVLPWWCLSLVFASASEGPWGSAQEVRLPRGLWVFYGIFTTLPRRTVAGSSASSPLRPRMLRSYRDVADVANAAAVLPLLYGACREAWLFRTGPRRMVCDSSRTTTP